MLHLIILKFLLPASSHKQSAHVLCRQELPHPVDELGHGEEGDAAKEPHDAANVGDHVDDSDGGRHDDADGGPLIHVDPGSTQVLQPEIPAALRPDHLQYPGIHVAGLIDRGVVEVQPVGVRLAGEVSEGVTIICT